MAQEQVHKIRWWVYTGEIVDGQRQRIPRQASMRGFWPGYEAHCETCDYWTTTGGGLRRYVAELVEEHKMGLRP